LEEEDQNPIGKRGSGQTVEFQAWSYGGKREKHGGEGKKKEEDHSKCNPISKRPSRNPKERARKRRGDLSRTLHEVILPVDNTGGLLSIKVKRQS